MHLGDRRVVMAISMLRGCRYLFWKTQQRQHRGIHVEKKIVDLGLQLPKPSVPVANFVNFVRRDNTLYLSGHLPVPADGKMLTGKVGKDLTVEDGYEASKFVGLQLIATLKANVDDLDKVSVTKIFALVNCVDSFDKHPAVVNGCSDLFVQVFGEKGRHARSAVGTNSLPFNVPVEIEAIFHLETS